MELKYKTEDVEKMIDVFSAIQEHKEKRDNAGIVNEIFKIVDYPVYIVQEFINCVNALAEANHEENWLKDHYLGVIGYIVIRLNIATEDSVKFPPEDM